MPLCMSSCFFCYCILRWYIEQVQPQASSMSLKLYLPNLEKLEMVSRCPDGDMCVPERKAEGAA